MSHVFPPLQWSTPYTHNDMHSVQGVLTLPPTVLQLTRTQQYTDVNSKL